MRTVAAFAFLAPLVALLAACSGGSGPAPSQSGSAADTWIVIDPAAGSSDVLTARLEAVALETSDGAVTANLLEAPRQVEVADPAGKLTGVRVSAPPAGSYQALHLLLGADSVRVQRPSGRAERVDLRAANLRVPFAQPVTGRASWIVLRHAESLALAPHAPRWDPEFVVATEEIIPLRLAVAEVVAVDLASLGATVALRDFDGMRASLRFTDDAVLLREPELVRLDVDAFVRSLEAGTQLLVDGILMGDHIDATSAIALDDDEPPGRGAKTVIRGTILELLPDTHDFRVSIQEVRKGEGNLPSPRPETLLVSTDDAQIRFPRRLHRGNRPVEFGALEVGQFVEVDWHGPVREGVVEAHKIYIRADAPAALLEVRGAVRAIDLETRRLTVALAEPIRIGDRRVEELQVEVVDGTLLVLLGAPPALVGLGDVRVGDTLRALGRLRGDATLIAELIRIVR
jgi:hypothetical protein